MNPVWWTKLKCVWNGHRWKIHRGNPSYKIRCERCGEAGTVRQLLEAQRDDWRKGQ